MPIAGSVPNNIDTHITYKKVTYCWTCSITYSLYFDDNEFLQYLQGNGIYCLLIFSYMRQDGFMLHVAYIS